MNPNVLMPIPSTDFDPSETGIPWKILRRAGIKVTIATPDGKAAECDDRMLHGTDLSIFSKLLKADDFGVDAYREMEKSAEFKNPIAWKDIQSAQYSALLLPGGHAPGMREYLESSILQKVVSDFFAKKFPVAAICHGVVLAARAKRSDGKSVLHGYRSTALLKSQEMSAWAMTALWLKNYYRTYPESVQSEVSRALANPEDFVTGPTPLMRDNPQHLSRGFFVYDRHYLSARWPGDAHAFGKKFAEIIKGSVD